MEPWYRAVTLRDEVREGRSFSPDEFAIALEQVVAGRAPDDYRDPAQFFSRTCFTRALSDHSGMVLRRLTGETANTAPVLTLITQFGGGKTHTLTALYHLANAGAEASRFPGVADLLARAGIAQAPSARVGVFVDLGADHMSASETLSGRVLGALRSEALLSDSVGAGYLDRHWPPAFDGSGAWPLSRPATEFSRRLSDPVVGPGCGSPPAGRHVRIQGRIRAGLWRRPGWRLPPAVVRRTDRSRRSRVRIERLPADQGEGEGTEDTARRPNAARTGFA